MIDNLEDKRQQVPPALEEQDISRNNTLAEVYEELSNNYQKAFRDRLDNILSTTESLLNDKKF